MMGTHGKTQTSYHTQDVRSQQSSTSMSTVVTRAGELEEPFDISFATPSMETASDLTQKDVLGAALLATFQETPDFDSIRVRPRKLERLEEDHRTMRNIDHQYSMAQRRNIDLRGSEYVVPSSNNNVHWKIGEFFLDLLICRGREVGLSAILPNVAVNYTIDFKMEFNKSPRIFSAKYAHLGFDPVGAMQFIGKTHRGEDAWIAWIPNEYQGDLLEEVDPVNPGQCSGDTRLSAVHFNGAKMYFMTQLATMGYKDVTIINDYPDLEDDYEVEMATTDLGRINLTIPQMRILHNRMRTTYDQWIADAPDSYRRDGFFTGRRPVAVTSRYGQNQPLGELQDNAEVEDRIWDEDRPWDQISHVTAALATHIRAKEVSRWVDRDDLDEIFQEAKDNGLFDSPDPFERESISREELEDLPMLQENGKEIPIFDSAGFPIARRMPAFLSSTLPLGGLINFADIDQMFGPARDDDDSEDGTPSTKFQVYPQAGLCSCGHVVAQGLMYPMSTFVNTLTEGLSQSHHEVDNDMDIDWERPDHPAVFGISCQLYNSVMHNTRGNSAQQHGVVLGNVTAALAGYWSRSTPMTNKGEALVRKCDEQLPHEEYLLKITTRPLDRDLRVENVVGITMAAIHPTQRTGRHLLNNVLLPIANYIRHPSVFNQLSRHIVLFKAKAFPLLYSWSTYALTSLITKIYKVERKNMLEDKPVNPMNVELCAVLERGLNFMHSGNIKVIAPTIMNPMWIGMALIQDGLPCLNPSVVRFYADSWKLCMKDTNPHQFARNPSSAAKCVILYNYGPSVYQRYIAHLTMALAMSLPTTKLTQGLSDIDTTVKTITYYALVVLIEDIRYEVQKEVDQPTKRLMGDRNPTISSHAISRRNALKLWNKSKAPLAWDTDGITGENYARLSLILCVDPNAEKPSLVLAKKPVSYDTLAGQFVNFASFPVLQVKNRRRSAPLTKSGGFQHVLPIAYSMIAKLVPHGNDILQYWSKYLISMMKSMEICLIPWHKETDRAFATDVNIWASLRQIKGLPSRPIVTAEDRIRVEAERIVRENPDAPWDVPARLADMKGLWKKHTLPTCWDVRYASLPAKSEKNVYVHATYDFVCERFDGAKWCHHLALIIAILFSRVVPDICLNNEAALSANNPTLQIKALPWISSSHKGTVAPLPFIVMMSTALIGFWDSRSPLAEHLQANKNALGTPWTNKHGTKQIHAINFIRMGLAIATTPGVKKNALLGKNWHFKSENELKIIHDQLVEWLTSNRFGEYLAVEYVFGGDIAKKLGQSKNEYNIPPHLL